jgi:HPt (histidine-containing phosphotransfer) domain-containing protein
MDGDENPQFPTAQKWAGNCEKYFSWKVPTDRGERRNCGGIPQTDSRLREALREPAHALQGAAANFAAAPVVEAARQLELQGRNGDLSQSLAAYDVLTREMQRLRRALGRASVRPRTTAHRQRQRKQGHEQHSNRRR